MYFSSSSSEKPCLQTSPKERRHSSRSVPSVILWSRVESTRLGPTFGVCLDAKQARQRATPTPMPTRAKVNTGLAYLQYLSDSAGHSMWLKHYSPLFFSPPTHFYNSRHYLGWRHPDDLSGEPKEIHSRNKNDLRRHQEEEWASWPHSLHQVCNFIKNSSSA